MAEQVLDIAVVGCGTGGPAAALLLARQGHRVTVFERVPTPGPVGAGFLLQPTGVEVLEALGLTEQVVGHASRVGRLLGTTAGGRTVMDLHYEELGPGLCGFGVHRGVLFVALTRALEAAGIPLRTGVEVARIEDGGGRKWLRETLGARHGPFDLVVVADGARSPLRGTGLLPARARTYPWGALWFMAADPDDAAGGALRQGFDGTTRMAGLLPSGRRMEDGPDAPPQVSLFWSLRLDALAAWKEAGLEPWKRELLRILPQAAPIVAQVHSAEQLTFATYQDVEMRRWDGEGLVFLGDAAHAMSPQLGQGVNLALRDAQALADCVGRLPLREALIAYSHARRAHLRYYTWATRFLTPFFQSRARPLGWLRDGLMGPLCALRPVRRQMLLSMAGAHRGFLRAPLPVQPTLPARTQTATPPEPGSPGAEGARTAEGVRRG